MSTSAPAIGTTRRCEVVQTFNSGVVVVEGAGQYRAYLATKRY
jgi:hypothetical protein